MIIIGGLKLQGKNRCRIVQLNSYPQMFASFELTELFLRRFIDMTPTMQKKAAIESTIFAAFNFWKHFKIVGLSFSTSKGQNFQRIGVPWFQIKGKRTVHVNKKGGKNRLPPFNR